MFVHVCEVYECRCLNRGYRAVVFLMQYCSVGVFSSNVYVGLAKAGHSRQTRLVLGCTLTSVRPVLGLMYTTQEYPEARSALT